MPANGISGIIDMPGLGAGVQCRAYGFTESIGLSEELINGPDTTGDWLQYVYHNPTGGVLVSASVPDRAGYPLPATWKGQRGTLVLDLGDGTAKQTLTVDVVTCTIAKKGGPDSPPEGRWIVTLNCKIVGEPVFSGFTGSKPVASVLDAKDYRTWANTVLNYDPHALQCGGEITYVLWGFSYTDDASEVSRVGSMLATVTCFTGVKARMGNIRRRGKTCAVVTLTLSTTDTADDVLLPRNVTNIDAGSLHLGDSATTAAINAVPPAPTGVQVLKVGGSTVKLNDGSVLYTDRYDRATSQQQIENAGTFVKTDVSDLNTAGAQTLLYVTGSTVPTPTVPSGLVQVASTPQKIDNFASKVVYEFGKTTPKLAREYAGTFEVVDPNGVSSQQQVSAVDATPALTGSYIARGTRTQTIETGHTIATIDGGLRSTIDDIEMPGTESGGDPQRYHRARTTTAAACLSTDTAAALAEAQVALYTSNQSYANEFMGVEVRKRHRTMAETTVLLETNDLLADINSEGSGEEPIMARLAEGAVQVFVAEPIIEVADGWWKLNIGWTSIHRVRTSIHVHRRSQLSINGSIALNFDLIGKTNNNTFLGFAAGTVTYLGINGNTNFSNWNNSPNYTRLTYRLVADSLGQFTTTGISPGVRPLYGDYSSLAGRWGWIDAYLLGFPDAIPLSAVSYSAMLLPNPKKLPVPITTVPVSV